MEKKAKEISEKKAQFYSPLERLAADLDKRNFFFAISGSRTGKVIAVRFHVDGTGVRVVLTELRELPVGIPIYVEVVYDAEPKEDTITVEITVGNKPLQLQARRGQGWSLNTDPFLLWPKDDGLGPPPKPRGDKKPN